LDIADATASKFDRLITHQVMGLVEMIAEFP